jgi:uncharacterized protein YkwD
MRFLALATSAAAMVMLSGCGGGFNPGGGGGAGGSGASGGSGGAGGTSLGATINATEPAQHCLDTLNMYRAQNGVPPAALDDALSTFSMRASQDLAAGGPDHGDFVAAGASLWSEGFCSSAAENQAPGWAIANGDEDATIDAILATMMSEGPKGQHHVNIVAAGNTRVGVGLVIDGKQQLWFTNDFSSPCN